MSVVIPTLNEEKCITSILQKIKQTVMSDVSLVDEIIVMDGGSTDSTKSLAEAEGVRFIDARTGRGSGRGDGKGLALWHAQFVTTGSIICYIDADIENFDERFVVGLLGPLLEDTSKGFVKAYYSRPLTSERGRESGGGGRVTELLIRPLFARFFPEASALIQPLSGEYSFRRSYVSQLRFSTSYAVETVLILEYLSKFPASTIEQVDMGERIHLNQPLENLSKMSAVILEHFSLLMVEKGLWATQGESVFASVHNKKVHFTPIEESMLPSAQSLDVLDAN